MIIFLVIIILLSFYVVHLLRLACEEAVRDRDLYKKKAAEWMNRFEQVSVEKDQLQRDLEKLQELREIEASRH